MAYFESSGAKLYYEEAGSGPPLIFLHGFGLDGRQWKEQADHFSARFRVITLDARGHGRSTLPPGEADPTVFYQDVVALMDALDIDKASLCGLSMGGHVAIQTAIFAPERVVSLVLIGAICTNHFNAYERVLLPVNRFCQRYMPMSWIAWSVAVGLSRFNKGAKPYIRETVGAMDHDVYNRAWRAVTDMESRSGLPSITCPVLLLIGDHDSMTMRQQQYMHENIKGSQLVTIKNAHHGTNLDNPQQVQAEMDAFYESIADNTH